MKEDNSDSYVWDDDFDRKKKRGSVKKTNDYKRKSKYKTNYLKDDY
tara:strand:+ start:1012 stop:1149 length:138 start_codon:yes stop_codon:yes gene_type:complete